MNYTELVQAIQDYTDNQEATFVAAIPTFVRQAEERILRTVAIPELRKNATTTVSTGNYYLGRPADILSVFSLAVVSGSGVYTYLLPKDVSFIREAYPQNTTQGTPKYYAQFDGDTISTNGNFILAPAADATYTVELHYYYDPPSIVTDGTSWLGEHAETVLLYGCLVEAYTFMKGDADLMQVYQTRYDDALRLTFGVSVRARRDEYRNGALGSKVPA